MGLANKVNGSNSTVAAGIDTKKLEYVKAKEICFEDGDPLILRGFFFQTGKYGESITLVTDKLGINAPDRYVAKFKEFTPDEVEQIKAGKMGISRIFMYETPNGETPMLEFIDIE